jgi:hypothetical protein
MPLYYFDVYDGETYSRDEEGRMFASREAARLEAMEALPHLIADGLLDREQREVFADIRDASGRIIYTAILSVVEEWRV